MSLIPSPPKILFSYLHEPFFTPTFEEYSYLKYFLKSPFFHEAFLSYLRTQTPTSQPNQLVLSTLSNS